MIEKGGGPSDAYGKPEDPFAPEQEVQLDHYLSMAHAAIAREGVRLNPDAPEDDALLSMYAAWIYRRRAGPDASGMPRMIRAELNDRKIAQAGGSA